MIGWIGYLAQRGQLWVSNISSLEYHCSLLKIICIYLNDQLCQATGLSKRVILPKEDEMAVQSVAEKK
jgi:hypothetical protein